MVTLVVALLALGIGPSPGDVVSPKDVAASSHLRGSSWATTSVSAIALRKVTFSFGPKALFDGVPETAWCEGVAGDGKGEHLDVTLDQPVAALQVVNGFLKIVHGGGTTFEDNGRVTALELSKDGAAPIRVPLADSKVLQTIPLKLDAGRWRITLAEVTPGAKFHDTCLGELRFLKTLTPALEHLEPFAAFAGRWRCEPNGSGKTGRTVQLAYGVPSAVGHMADHYDLAIGFDAPPTPFHAQPARLILNAIGPEHVLHALLNDCAPDKSPRPPDAPPHDCVELNATAAKVSDGGLVFSGTLTPSAGLRPIPPRGVTIRVSPPGDEVRVSVELDGQRVEQDVCRRY